MTTLDPRTIAADLMTTAAREVDRIDVWAHIGQAYDVDVVEDRIDAGLADTVIDLIGKAGIDLIWPDGSTDTELDAQRVENERLTAELDRLRAELDQERADRIALARERDLLLPVAEAAQEWRWSGDTADGHQRAEASLMAAVDALPHPPTHGDGCPACRASRAAGGAR